MSTTSPIKHALMIVDIQNDFLPGGALGVDGGFDIIDPIVQMSTEFDLVVASRDWHPVNHCSFATEPTFEHLSWPIHCVADTPGAQLHSRISAVSDLIVSKGWKPDEEALSAFAYDVCIAKSSHNDIGATVNLAHYLQQLSVTHVSVVGIATDYCVNQTAQGARDAGFQTTIIPAVCRAVDPAAGDACVAAFND